MINLAKHAANCPYFKGQRDFFHKLVQVNGVEIHRGPLGTDYDFRLADGRILRIGSGDDEEIVVGVADVKPEFEYIDEHTEL